MIMMGGKGALLRCFAKFVEEQKGVCSRWLGAMGKVCFAVEGLIFRYVGFGISIRTAICFPI